MEKNTCQFFSLCGGCNLLNVAYDTQLKNKQKQVKDCFKEFNINAVVSSVVGMYYPYKYRNKMHLAIREVKGKPEIGFFMENSNKIVAVNDCLLFDKWASVVIEIVKQFIKNFKISAYNKQNQTGILKYVVVRVIDGAILITLVVTSNNFAGKEWLLTELNKNFKAVSLHININNRSDNAVFDERGFIQFLGYKKLRGKMLGVQFELSPNSFFQVNTEITSKIYANILSEIDKSQNAVVLDLYSGIGITSCLFASSGADVISIESVPSAVKDAQNLIALNKLKNITPIVGRCEQVINRLNLSKIKNKYENVFVFIDPPRIGCVKTVLDEILQFKPDKIIYLSCNPTTLSRDVKILLDGGYKIEKVVPYDMFPQTNHIETLCVLKKVIN